MEKKSEKTLWKIFIFIEKNLKVKKSNKLFGEEQRIEAREEKKHENHLQVIVWFDCVRFAFVEFALCIFCVYSSRYTKTAPYILS